MCAHTHTLARRHTLGTQNNTYSHTPYAALCSVFVFADVVTYSDTVEVFSHTIYLNGRANAADAHFLAGSSSPSAASFTGLGSGSCTPAAASVGSPSVAATSDAHQPPRPVCLEILPPAGPRRGGARVVVLGYHFARGDKLLVRFGDVDVPGTFHEEGTVIATAPPHTPGLV